MMNLELTTPATPHLVVVEPRLEYPGFLGPAACAFAHTLVVGDHAIYALVVELEKNRGTSVTNAAEAVHQKVRNALAPWVDPEGARAYTLVCFEAYEHRIRQRREAGQAEFSDPWTTIVKVDSHGVVEWPRIEERHRPVIEVLTRALVREGAICPGMAEAART